MLVIARGVLGAVVDHCRAQLPLEACGIVAGPTGSDRPARVVSMVNAEQSARLWRFDPAEQLAVYADLDGRNEDPVVVYHSHPTGWARPSPADVQLAGEPDAHYLIVALRGGTPEVRSWRVQGGIAVEEPITVEEN